MTKKKTKIKPCPFCGGQAELDNDASTFGLVDKPKEDKKYYCICGSELEIIQSEGRWDANCTTSSQSGFHTWHFGLASSKAELIAELEKLPKKENK